MPFPLLGLGLGAGLGLIKSAVSDAPRAERQRRVQAETTRWSPWTGMTGQAPDSVDAFGNAMQGGLTGASFQQMLPMSSGSSYSGMIPEYGGGSESVPFAPYGQRVGGYMPR